jgi:hypothetical protein
VGDHVYYGPNLYGFQFINTSEIPYGTRTGFYVSNASGKYNSRIYYKTIVPGTFYNFSFYLPVTNTSYLYYLKIIEKVNTGFNIEDVAVPDCLVTIKRYLVSTNVFETVASLLTDDEGMVNVYLIPNTYYKVSLNKSGFVDSTSDYIPANPNVYGQTDLKVFTIVRTTSVNGSSTISDVRGIEFDAMMNINGSLLISYSASIGGPCAVLLRIYEDVNYTKSLIASFNYTECNNSFWYSPVNISREYEVELYMNFSDTLGGLFHSVKFVYPLTAALYNGSAIEKKISDVWGQWGPGYVKAFIIFGGFLFWMVLLGKGTGEPGYGAMSGGLWLAFSNSLITGLNLINIYEVSAFCCAIGFLLLMLHWRRKKA